jgi:hypothetical protein
MHAVAADVSLSLMSPARVLVVLLERLVDVVPIARATSELAAITRASPLMGATATRVPTMSSGVAPTARAVSMAQW